MPPTVSSSTQMSSPSHANVNMQTSVAIDPLSLVLPVLHLDWAEDATSLPILPLLSTPSAPCQHHPQVFIHQGLTHSAPSNIIPNNFVPVFPHFHQNIPFSQSSYPHYQLPPLNSSSSFPKLWISPQASKNKPFISPPLSCTSALDWDQDPHLSDLSQVLK